MTDHHSLARGNNAAGMLDNLINTLTFTAKTVKITYGEKNNNEVPAPFTLGDIAGLHNILLNCIEVCETTYHCHMTEVQRLKEQLKEA